MKKWPDVVVPFLFVLIAFIVGILFHATMMRPARYPHPTCNFSVLPGHNLFIQIDSSGHCHQMLNDIR